MSSIDVSKISLIPEPESKVALREVIFIIICLLLVFLIYRNCIKRKYRNHYYVKNYFPMVGSKI